MKNGLKTIIRLMTFFGFNFKKTVNALKSIPSFYRDYRQFKKQAKGSTSFAFSGLFPCIGERQTQDVKVLPEYFYQDLLIAEMIYNNNPEKHVDIGSRVDGFVASVSLFRPIEVFDIQKLTNIKNITFVQADFMSIAPELHDYCDSLSCLHALEHFGLGRYGDPVCFDGHTKGLESMYSVLKTGGKFYLSVPIGPQRIEFNSHRVFSIAYLMDLFKERYQLDSFSYIDDKGTFHERIELDEAKINDNCGCRTGCGIFELTKL